MISMRNENNICRSLKYLITARIQGILEVVNDDGKDSNTVERFHELRKQVRALRALLIFVKPLDLEHRLNEGRRKLRDWFRAGNIRRDLDVLDGQWEMLQGHLPSSRDASLLSKYLHANNLSAMAIAPSIQLVAPLLEIRAVMEQGEWCAEKKTLTDFVKKHLRRWDRAIENAGNSLESMDKKGIHTLRIRCKNLRYAAEAFLPLLKGDDTISMVRVLRNLQNLLGQIHDIDNTPAIISEASNNNDPHIAFEIGFLLGWQAAARIDLMRLLEKEWKRYLKAKQSWRNAN